jgi:exonuclease III
MKRIAITTLNIAAASKERARRILDEWISQRPSDVYILTESSEGTGTELVVSEFRSSGWAVFQRLTAAKDRGVVVATRICARECTAYPADDPAPGRTLLVDLQTTPAIRLVAMYVPNRGNDPTKTARKRAFLDTWLRCLTDKPQSVNRILIGDLNVVPPPQRPQFLPQERFEYEWYHALIQQAGLYDAALVHGAGRHEDTWVAHTGEGYTYDHILPEKSLSGRVSEFHYDHSTRQRDGVTDHSAIVVALNVDSVNLLHERDFTVPKQGELF